MQLTIIDINIRDLDTDHIEGEFNDRNTDYDFPTDEENAYYMHRGHRIFFSFHNPDATRASFNLNNDNLAAISSFVPAVSKTITAAGATAEPGWTFSRYAWCGMCPCVPGFFVDGDGPSKQVFLDVLVEQ